MTTKARYVHIDYLRAIATVGFIFTHVLSDNLGNPRINFLWNYMHFVVVGLVFCSAYVYAAAHESQKKLVYSFSWVKKRFLRLYVPFVIYLATHYILWFIFPHIFHGYQIKRSWSFILSSLTLTGGIDIGWIPVLFLELSLIFPLLLVIARRRKSRDILLILLALATLLMTFFRVFDEYSRALAWIPWSLVALLGFIYFDAQKASAKFAKRLSIMTVGVMSIAWILLFMILRGMHNRLTLTVHKYPPDLYFLSYGIAITAVLLLLLTKKYHKQSRLTDFTKFVSSQSYTIFFVQYIVLDMVITNLRIGWFAQTLIVLALCLLGAYCWTKLLKLKLQRKAHKLTRT